MNEQSQDQDERDNLSGADMEEAWLAEFAGWYLCPYCGKESRELVMCCGEIHGEIIGE